MISILISILIYLSQVLTPCDQTTYSTQSGTGPSNTYLFQVESPWTLKWSADSGRLFILKARTPDNTARLSLLAINLQGGSYAGTTQVYGISGEIYIHVNTGPETNWRVEVR